MVKFAVVKMKFNNVHTILAVCFVGQEVNVLTCSRTWEITAKPSAIEISSLPPVILLYYSKTF